ncbi:hypothetical protein ACLOJK_031096 [Asimina triloba]
MRISPSWCCGNSAIGVSKNVRLLSTDSNKVDEPFKAEPGKVEEAETINVLPPPSEKLLVLGGNGFVGSHVCKEAVDLGLSVSSLSRSGRSNVNERWANAVTWHQGNLLLPESWKDVLDDVTSVISCVGGFGSNSYMYKINGTANINAIRAAAEKELSRIVKGVAMLDAAPTKVNSDSWKENKRFLECDGGIILRPGFIHGTRQVGSMKIPLGVIGSPMEMVLQHAKPLTRVPLLGPLFTPPVGATTVAKVAVRAATDPVFPPGIVDVYGILRYVRAVDVRLQLQGRNKPFFLKRITVERSYSVLTTSSSSWGHGGRVVDEAAKDGELRVFMVAGEVSGDTIASRLISSLKLLSPLPVRLAGVGGTLMRKEGLQSIYPMEDISVMGLLEVLPHLVKIGRRLKETVEAAIRFRPHVVVTVDSKAFSFSFLKQLRARCVEQRVTSPVQTHYVAPSFWAWKGGESRLPQLSGYVDHLFCILPFEVEVCRSNGLAATFVGHPIIEDALNLNLEGDPPSEKWKVQGNGKCFQTKHGLSSGATVITLLPGSRLQEVKRMLPIYSKTMKLLRDSFPELTTVIPVAPNQHVESYIERTIRTWDVPTILFSGQLQKPKYDAFAASRAALSTSGTAVLELQLAWLPCVVAYRANVITEWLIRYRTKSQYMSLPNILLDSSVIPEVLFHSCKPKNLASFLTQVISDEHIREQQRGAAKEIFELLSSSDRSAWNLAAKEVPLPFTDVSPSMIAASTILYTVKRHG